MISPLTQKDFYKTDHRRQYPDGTTKVYSNLTPRSDRLFTGSSLWDKKIVWFGIQKFILDYIIKEYNDNFFNQPKDLAVKQYKRRLDTSLGEGSVPVDHIEKLHDLGFLPIRIKSLPEGSRVNIRVPVLSITNTHPDFYWLTNDLETVMSCDLWKTATVATIAFEYHKILTHYAMLTGSPLEFVQFQGHDFSMRGMSNRQDAATCGMGHLLSFTGTDTIPAIDYAELYYDANSEKELIGTSVPATEHSVMCMGGKNTEIETFKRLIKDVYPSGIVSIVSDTWDFWRVVTEYVSLLKQDILSRPANALGLSKVVIRPDSGDPVKIICGSVDVIEIDASIKDLESAKHMVADNLISNDATPHGKRGADTLEAYFRFNGEVHKIVVELDWGRYDKQYYYIDDSEIISCEKVELTPEQKGAVQCLWEVFGGTTSSTGHKILDSHIGLIYGDSITLQRAETILAKLASKGFASCNVVFGIGSFTYQYITRDTFGFAVKATYGEINGEPVELEKDPITDNGTKKSACGLLQVTKLNGDFYLNDRQTKEQEQQGELRTIFEDGKLIVRENFSTIRKRLGALG